MEGSNKHGYGTYTWADGSIYVGEYKNDKYHGNGTYTYANGDKYVGQMKDGNFNGQGTYTLADGTIEHSGEWVNDEPKKELALLKESLANHVDEEEERRK